MIVNSNKNLWKKLILFMIYITMGIRDVITKVTALESKCESRVKFYNENPINSKSLNDENNTRRIFKTTFLFL